MRFKEFIIVMFLGFFCFASNFLILIEIIGAILGGGEVLLNFNRYNELGVELILMIIILIITINCLIYMVRYHNKERD